MTESASKAAAGSTAAAADRAASARAGPAANSHAAGRATQGAVAPGAQARSRLSTEGLLAAAGSFVIWGLFPLYLKPLHEVSSLQIIAHRVAWACVLVCVWLWIRGDLGQLRKALTTPATLWRLSATALLISINW